MRVVLVWIAVCVASAALCWSLTGMPGVTHALGEYAHQTEILVPRFLAGVLIGGFAQVLIPRDVVAHWLGQQSGIKGMILASGVGAIAPGGPMVAFPLVMVLRKAGAGPSSLVAFVTAWSTIGLHRMITWEVPLLGLEIAALRYGVSLPLGVIAGLLTIPVTRLFKYNPQPDP